MWEVRGAGHEDIHDYSPLEYERRVGGFLVAHLRGPVTATESASVVGREPGWCLAEATGATAGDLDGSEPGLQHVTSAPAQPYKAACHLPLKRRRRPVSA